MALADCVLGCVCGLINAAARAALGVVLGAANVIIDIGIAQLTLLVTVVEFIQSFQTVPALVVSLVNETIAQFDDQLSRLLPGEVVNACPELGGVLSGVTNTALAPLRAWGRQNQLAVARQKSWATGIRAAIADLEALQATLDEIVDGTVIQCPGATAP